MSGQLRGFCGILAFAVFAVVCFSAPSDAIPIRMSAVDQILDNAEFVGEITGVRDPGKSRNSR
jgi:hypothetical protein